MNRNRFAVSSLVVSLLLAGSIRAESTVNFNRDIRPILSDKCFLCHGPDANRREAKLRLDTREGATKDLDGYQAIVPGDPDDSEVVVRIYSDDKKEIMPPPKSKKSLTQQEKDLIRQWIKQGAEYQAHWSLIPPKSSPRPKVKRDEWVRNPIDAFVLSRLESENLQPSPEADKATLIRRVTLDLTGRPPTPAEVDAFLKDTTGGGGAFEKVVDRLLQSKQFGERMALVWLDAARYADTNGYQVDRGRQMWIWRDWVIRAYNANMPFDQFTIEQIAGDMLPNATIDQKIASGFNRNHRINGEGGVIPEEFRTEYVIDRVGTTGTVWLGLTLSCARCHSHKFDPVSQKEFYQLFAYFNNVPENGRDGLKGNAVPVLSVPIPEKQAELRAVEQKVVDLQKQLTVESAEFRAEQQQWEQRTLSKLTKGGVGPMWSLANVATAESTGNVNLKRLEDESFLATGANPATPTYTVTIKSGPRKPRVLTGVRLEALMHPNMTKGGLSRSVNGNFVLTEFELLRHSPDMNEPQPVKIASAIADHSQENYPIAQSIDGNKGTGWAILGKPKPGNRTAVFTLAEPLTLKADTSLIIRLKHDSRFPAHAIGRFRFSLTDADKPALEGKGQLPLEVIAALQTPASKRSKKQRRTLADFYRPRSRALAPFRKQLAAAKKQLDQMKKTSTTTVMVMQEMDKPRPAFYLNRGQYDQPGEQVQPGIPASLGRLPKGAPNNRLGLARWLVDATNPLTARVTVNRYWQMYFGLGLVKSVDDFGSQGEWPSHPELLDWLATEFVRSGWDVKAMQKLIVTSATYRQSSRITPQSWARDPENRLLARGPRFRLSAATIRDQALAISGLLVEKVGGPSVKPYQPDGLWQQVAGRSSKSLLYRKSAGEGLYRRSMYTYWKRAVAPPTMIIFDAGGREACNVGRNATNTPLQSLATLNDVQFVEAARVLAQRMMTEGGTLPADRLTYGWRLAMARRPDATELKTLVNGYEGHLKQYQSDMDKANALLAVGDTPRDASLNVAEHAALTAMASTILNLDEVITKE